MNISDLAKGVADATGSSETETKAVMTSMFDLIADAAAKGEEISIHNFGKFTVKDQPERQGRNPSSGEAITIAASKKLSFKAAKALKDKL